MLQKVKLSKIHNKRTEMFLAIAEHLIKTRDPEKNREWMQKRALSSPIQPRINDYCGVLTREEYEKL